MARPEQEAVPKIERHYGALPVAYRPDATVPELIVETVLRCPDGIALLGEEGALRYSDLLLRAQNVTVRLRRLGIGMGDAVGIVSHRSFQSIAGILGILLAGAAYVPLAPPSFRGPASAQEEAAFLKHIDSCGITTVLVDSSLESGTSRWGEPAIRWLDLAETEREKMPLFAESELPQLTPADTAALLESAVASIENGRTVLTHGAMTQMASSAEIFGLRGAHSLLLWMPFTEPSHALALWGALLGGATLALAPGEVVGPDALAYTLRQYRVTSLMLPAQLFARLAEEMPEALRGLDQLAIYAEQSGAQPPGQRQLEAVLSHAPDLRILFSANAMDGAAYAPVEVRIATAIRSEAALAMEERLPLEAVDGLRPAAKEMRAYGPETLEALLREHSLVAQCAVVPLSEEQALTCAFVALASPGGVKPEEMAPAARARVAGEQLWAYLAERVPAEARPARIVIRPDLPVNQGGELDRPLLQMEARNELRERRGPARVDRNTYLAYAGQVREIWTGLLHRSDIGLDEDFYAAGGTQLDMIRLHAEMNRRFPGAITMADVPVLRTVRTLVNHLLRSMARDRTAGMEARRA